MFAAHIATVSIPICVFHNLSSATLIKTTDADDYWQEKEVHFFLTAATSS
jgi:hypothetical protein